MNNESDNRSGSGTGQGSHGAGEMGGKGRGPDERGQSEPPIPIGSMPARELKEIFDPSEMF